MSVTISGTNGVSAVQDNTITSAKIVDGAVTNADINASAAIAASKLSGVGGITEADEWRLTTNVTTNGFLTANLERNDNASFNKLGTGMSEASGVFTFPSSGYWLIKAHGDFYVTGSDSYNFELHATTNNSSYTNIVTSYGGGATGTHPCSLSSILDVTDTANVKVKFNLGSISTTTLRGDTTVSITYFEFIRLGDT